MIQFFRSTRIVVARYATLRLLALSLLLLVAAGPAAAQGTRLTGQVFDKEGKPFPDVIVQMKHEDTGRVLEVKTDKSGKYIQVGLQGGLYEVSFKFNNQVFYTLKTRLATGEEKVEDVNVKKLIEQQGAVATEARKKQEEDTKKFESLKASFDSGRASLEQARQARSDQQRAPADQRGAMQQKVTELSQAAITSFQAAESAAGEKDPNLPIIYSSLGDAHEIAGHFEEAVAAYQKAIALKPTDAGYYNNLGNTLARLGKIPEAGAAYEKSASLNPANAANAWRNFGIVLYNANKLKEAVDPLTKATQIDPSNADAWYLLGACLLASMESKQEGDKINFIVKPGTAEAYQKYLELAPSGRFAADAKAALASLESLGVGVSTKVRGKKK